LQSLARCNQRDRGHGRFKEYIDRVRWGRATVVVIAGTVIVRIAMSFGPSYSSEDLRDDFLGRCRDGATPEVGRQEAGLIWDCLLTEMTTAGTALAPMVEEVGLFDVDMVQRRVDRGEEFENIVGLALLAVVLRREYAAAYELCRERTSA
jgi:hypothetical protein